MINTAADFMLKQMKIKSSNKHEKQTIYNEVK